MPIPSIKSILSISVYKIYPRLSRLKKTAHSLDLHQLSIIFEK